MKRPVDGIWRPVGRPDHAAIQPLQMATLKSKGHWEEPFLQGSGEKARH